jgi:hypothetical protein
VKNNLYFIFYSLCVFLISFFNLFIGLNHQNNTAYLVIGIILLAGAVGIVLLKNFVRKAMLLLSKLFIFLIYLPLWILLFLGKLDDSGGVGILALAPVFIICLLTISCLTKENVVTRFEKKEVV